MQTIYEKGERTKIVLNALGFLATIVALLAAFFVFSWVLFAIV